MHRRPSWPRGVGLREDVVVGVVQLVVITLILLLVIVLVPALAVEDLIHATLESALAGLARFLEQARARRWPSARRAPLSPQSWLQDGPDRSLRYEPREPSRLVKLCFARRPMRHVAAHRGSEGVVATGAILHVLGSTARLGCHVQDVDDLLKGREAPHGC